MGVIYWSGLVRWNSDVIRVESRIGSTSTEDQLGSNEEEWGKERWNLQRSTEGLYDFLLKVLMFLF